MVRVVAASEDGLVNVTIYGAAMTPLEAEALVRDIQRAIKKARAKTPPRRKRMGDY